MLFFAQTVTRSFRQIKNKSTLLILLSVKMMLILWPMRESGHKCDSSWSKWWISRGWGVVYLWSNVSQIESAILSQTVTLDIELREATAKKTAPNQPDSFPFRELWKYKLPSICWYLAKRYKLFTKECIWQVSFGGHICPPNSDDEGKGWRWWRIWGRQTKGGMLHPAWVILCPTATMARWNLGSKSEINVSSVNLWVKLHVWLYWW